jgi:hypothetical protein
MKCGMGKFVVRRQKFIPALLGCKPTDADSLEFGIIQSNNIISLFFFRLANSLVRWSTTWL